MTRPSALTLVLSCALAAACDPDPKPTQDKASADAGAEAPVLDRNIEDAVASAAAISSAAPQAIDGPPPTGVFGPGEADKAFTRGGPPKLEMLGEGSEPRVSLRPGALPVEPLELRLQVSRRTVQQGQQQVLPNIDFTVALLTGAALEGDAKDKKAKATDEETPAPSGPQAAALQVKKATLSAEQPGQLPPGLAQELAKVQGSRLVGTIAPDGGFALAGIELAKDADRGLAGVLAGLADSTGLLFAPMPDKPVGVGAYWMTTDRLDTGGGDVVRYRVTRVTALEGAKVTLDVDIRQYLASADHIKGLPAGVDIAYDTQGKAQLSRGVGALAPSDGEVAVPVELFALAQGQRLPVMQTLTEAVLLPAAAAPAGSAKP